MGFGSTFFNPLTSPTDSISVHLFSKHLQFLDYEGMSEAAADMGFDGLDLTVRPNGHVEPNRVTDDLPEAVEAMQKFGLRPEMMTTDVVDPADALSKTVLETAAELGFKHYRTGWLTYPENKSIPESMAAYVQLFSSLETLNKELGLVGAYQNHAGNHVGAPIWDTYEILKGTNSEFIGAQYDIRHAVVEGGSSWELGLRLIKDYIRTIAIKDFKWGQVDGQWKPINVPLGEGMVDFDQYFSVLKKFGINVPVSLHLEYELGGAEHGASSITIDEKEVFGRMKKDLEFLREAWEKAE
jgi:sugar phosphate isomerase/epimerase